MTKKSPTFGMSIADKLDYYTYPEPNTGCWLWGGGVVPGGYGTLQIKGKTVLAHRLSWEEHNGPIPKGLLVLHKCDVPPCINPEHLFLGSQKDNIQDAVEKGRIAFGERNNRAKLTEDEVIQILKDSRPSKEVCLDYNIGKGAINDIRAGRTWSYLNAPVNQRIQAVAAVIRGM